MPTPSLSTFGLRIQEEYVVVSVAGREASDGSVLLAAVVVAVAPTAAAAGSAVLSFLAVLFSSTSSAAAVKRKHEKSLNPPMSIDRDAGESARLRLDWMQVLFVGRSC